jgi:transketolase
MPKNKLPELTTAGLQRRAHELRLEVIKMLTEAGSGHSAGPLGTAEIFAVLYFAELNVDPSNPEDPQRDRFFLSNGHICPILYAALAERGFFPHTELKKLRKIDSLLQGHPDRKIPGVETAGGSLGQGICVAVGAALAHKIDKSNTRTYTMTSDGELNEGQTWEAAMLATKYKLDNLLWIIDRNNIQIGGATQQIMPLENLRDKLESFNWYVLEIDGHNIMEIKSAFSMAKRILQRPTAIIAHTTPGKGVDFMENKSEWHGKPPSEKEADQALEQIKNLIKKVK